MIRYINKKTIIIISIALLLLVCVGTTLAFVFTDTDPIENTFTPSQVSCAVVEANGDAVYGSIVNTGTTKTNVKVINTGNTEAYIRVAVVINWSSADGEKVWAIDPVPDVEYRITYDLDNGWFYKDGFFYYKEAISPTESTSELIKEAVLLGDPPLGTDNTQYYLSVEIVASAIQSTPAQTVSDNWGVSVKNGFLSTDTSVGGA